MIVNVHIDFPALDSLVSYYKTRDDQQKQIDALTAKAEELASSLKRSETGLESSVEANKQ
jgi:hypothetical protein